MQLILGNIHLVQEEIYKVLDWERISGQNECLRKTSISNLFMARFMSDMIPHHPMIDGHLDVKIWGSYLKSPHSAARSHGRWIDWRGLHTEWCHWRRRPYPRHYHHSHHQPQHFNFYLHSRHLHSHYLSKHVFGIWALCIIYRLNMSPFQRRILIQIWPRLSWTSSSSSSFKPILPTFTVLF